MSMSNESIKGKTIRLPYALAQMEVRRTEKKAIAKHIANKLIDSQTTVFLDAGSTVRLVAQEIFSRETSMGGASAHEQLKLCIITNNMFIFQDFNKYLQDGDLPADHSLSLVLTGGEYDMQHDALFGTIAVASLDAIKCHVSIIGTSGITLDKEGGPHSHALTAEKVIKKSIFKKKVQHRIIVCDHTKLGQEDSLLCGKTQNIIDKTERCTIVIGVPNKVDFLRKKIDAELAGYFISETNFKEKEKELDQLCDDIQKGSGGSEKEKAEKASTDFIKVINRLPEKKNNIQILHENDRKDLEDYLFSVLKKEGKNGWTQIKKYLSYLLSIYFVVCNDEKFKSKKDRSQKRIEIENNIADIIFTQTSDNRKFWEKLKKVDSDPKLESLEGNLDIESLKQIHRLIKKRSEFEKIIISAPKEYEEYDKKINDIYKNEIKKIEKFMCKIDINKDKIDTLSQPYLTIVRPELNDTVTYIKK